MLFPMFNHTPRLSDRADASTNDRPMSNLKSTNERAGNYSIINDLSINKLAFIFK